MQIKQVIYKCHQVIMKSFKLTTQLNADAQNADALWLYPHFKWNDSSALMGIC